MRGALHALLSDLVGALFAIGIGCLYALAVVAFVWGWCLVLSMWAPEAPVKSTENGKERL